MAEGVGFEPTVQLPVHGISSAAPSATRPPLQADIARAEPRAAMKMAEGRGFEPPRDLRPYPISSRTPSTGLGHPSGPVFRSFHRSPRDARACGSSTVAQLALHYSLFALKNALSSAAHSSLLTPPLT